MFIVAPVSAQTATTGPFNERPDDALSRNLRSLAANPKSVTALMGAGKAALELGDPQAALTFFARAEEQLPKDGRIKMWIGSALTQLQQPHAALKFFRDATELGVPEADVAGERGLAQDVAGNPRQAQRDYRLALQHGRNDDITRRLALSLAISGEREPALRLLEDQLLVRDRAAERTRALVLALTGDAAGATRAVQAGMPGPQAGAMAPFLARLPTLAPSERALAVHFGIFPGDGRTPAASVPSTYAANAYNVPAPVTEAGRPDESQSSLARRVPLAEPVSDEPRRRPGSATTTASAERPAAERSASQRPAPSRPARGGGAAPIDSWALARGVLPSSSRRQPEPKPKPAETAPATKPAEQFAAAVIPAPADPQPQPEGPPATETTDVQAQAAAEPPEAQPAEVPVADTSSAAPPPQTEPASSGSRLADLSATLATIPEAEPAPARPKPAARSSQTAAAAAKPAGRQAAASAPPKKAKPAPPAEPSRVWVQVAGGAIKSALPREFARIKAKAPKLLGSRSAWTTPLNATNRLLVGPFPGAKEAQAFVNQLKAADLTAFAWTSPAGQKIEKLPAK